MNELMKPNKRLKYFHIALIILGTIFIALPAFHSNLWFDESYSVEIANHSFKDIWVIGGNDVHPVLFYWILHILNLIFGNNVIIYRLFCVLCTALLGLVGYTHIRKDFGERIGILFSFLVFFFPVNVVYSSEIRMYSLAMLLVTLTAIYAYRIYKNINEKIIVKNWILFALFSLSAAYTHYYALMSSGLINGILFLALLFNCIKNKKLNKNMIAFIIFGIIQILGYIPWIVSLFTQIKQVKDGFWIQPRTFKEITCEIFTFIFSGNLKDSIYENINGKIAVVFGLFVTIYIIILSIKYFINLKNENLEFRKQYRIAFLAIILFIGIAISAGIVSSIMSRSILYARYMLCVMGLLIFFISYMLEKKGLQIINLVICVISLLLSLYVNVEFININYDKSNKEPISFMTEDLQENDILIMGNEGSGFVLSVYFPENISYFYDEQYWNCDEAYKAFSDDFRTVHDLDFLENYSGRIWVINTTHYSIYEKIKDKYDVNLIKQKMFSVEYKKYQYSITLIEK